METEKVRKNLARVVEGVGGTQQASLIFKKGGMDFSSAIIGYWLKRSKMSPRVCRLKVLPVIEYLSERFLELSRVLEKTAKPIPEISQDDILGRLKGLVKQHGSIAAAARYSSNQVDCPRYGSRSLDVSISRWLRAKELSPREKIRVLQVCNILGRPSRIEADPKPAGDILIELISFAEEAIRFLRAVHPEHFKLISNLSRAANNAKSLL